MTRTGGCRREQMQALAGGESAVGRKQSSGVSCAGHGVSPWHVSSTAPVQCTARHAGDGVQRLDDATGASNCEAAAGNRRHDSPGGGQRQRQLTRRSRDSSLKRMHAYASRVQQDSAPEECRSGGGCCRAWRRGGTRTGHPAGRLLVISVGCGQSLHAGSSGAFAPAGNHREGGGCAVGALRAAGVAQLVAHHDADNAVVPDHVPCMNV